MDVHMYYISWNSIRSIGKLATDNNVFSDPELWKGVGSTVCPKVSAP